MIYRSPRGEYPRYAGDIQLVQPDWAEGDALPSGWEAVAETERPAVGENQYAEDIGPGEAPDRSLVQRWETRDKTAEQIAITKKLDAEQRLLGLGVPRIEVAKLILDLSS
tara:strand:+ start:810 stop:1139 length:330 start_codon:yes stop_codon:yes gene_type:complete